MLTEQAVSSIADRVLRDALRDHGYQRVVVHSGRNHEDEPALFIEAVLKDNIPVVRGEVINSAHAALREALLQNDELRFPFLWLVHPDDVYAADSAPKRTSGRTRRADG
ncbi:MAG: hypothetical protein JO288_22025 [Hyphomicrobiales bacterium]|nr:hypothetical protein [Hyphomicrobiales bacterium]